MWISLYLCKKSGIIKDEQYMYKCNVYDGVLSCDLQNIHMYM